ncbi:hypothetical protein [Methylococcus geothermalis]|uniref:Uncharacterized protein n=1 Tax=Methylococcus geothermalis TaxID=2681310 RepID=A0A858QAX0_9GAMM|nr:hypothetical protein [Methylococcus geothermalis]QJD31082.1 hypothetical protein GNH96_14765 [Methylococcus geothermalis]
MLQPMFSSSFILWDGVSGLFIEPGFFSPSLFPTAKATPHSAASGAQKWRNSFNCCLDGFVI